MSLLRAGRWKVLSCAACKARTSSKDWSCLCERKWSQCHLHARSGFAGGSITNGSASDRTPSKPLDNSHRGRRPISIQHMQFLLNSKFKEARHGLVENASTSIFKSAASPLERYRRAGGSASPPPLAQQITSNLQTGSVGRQPTAAEQEGVTKASRQVLKRKLKPKPNPNHPHLARGPRLCGRTQAVSQLRRMRNIEEDQTESHRSPKPPSNGPPFNTSPPVFQPVSSATAAVSPQIVEPLVATTSRVHTIPTISSARSSSDAVDTVIARPLVARTREELVQPAFVSQATSSRPRTLARLTVNRLSTCFCGIL